MDSRKKATILVVDDNVDTVELLSKRLRASGYHVEAAQEGGEGLRKVRELHPDLVLLDIMMPNIDGYEVCRRMKEDDRTRDIPVLMLTARTEVSDKVRGLDTGADGYITKPFDYKEVEARVRSLLSKKNATCQQAAREKHAALDTLVNEVSHEVRNPLVAIGGFARRLQNSMAADDPNRRYLEIILRNVETLEKMVDKLVVLKGASVSYMERTDINDIIEQALDRFTTVLSEQGISVERRLMPDPPPVAADRDNLTTVIANIVENAIEAMADRPQRRLGLATRIKDGFLEIEISDTGRGIPRQTIKNIYDPFYTSKTYGPGLGLTFALKTIQNHKGMITVDSTEGEGSRFLITLPLAVASGSAGG